MWIHKMKNIYPIILSLAFIIFSCGEGTVEIGPSTYIPKIVIEGYVYPGKKVENIRITRNVPMAAVPGSSIILEDAVVKIMDVQSGIEYKLKYDSAKFSFKYDGNDLIIGYDKSYKLTVSAVIDGKTLQASSVTHVPKEGFRILQEESIVGSIKYREKDSEGNPKLFKVVFAPSVGTSFYAISIVALEADINNFIYDNPYFEVEKKDLKEDFDTYKYQFKWLQNVKSTADKTFYDVEWLDTWFYCNYRLIIYAADENFRLFAQTHKMVQEFDGNFHEPRMKIQGDGIGVFGSAIADTVYFQVLK